MVLSDISNRQEITEYVIGRPISFSAKICKFLDCKFLKSLFAKKWFKIDDMVGSSDSDLLINFEIGIGGKSR